jgi:hypothetical protein
MLAVLKKGLLCLPVVLVGCSDEIANAPADRPYFDHITDNGAEGELLGRLFIGQSRNTETGYTARIDPIGSETKSRLRGADTLGSEMVAKPGGWAPKYWDYEWFDPKGGGNCGDLASYESNHQRAPERHTSDPNPGEEKHCIRPGTYRFTLKQGTSIIKTFIFQYGQVPQSISVNNQTTGTHEFVNAVTYDPAYHFLDAIINVDLAGPGSYSENSVVHIQNAGGDPYDTTFVDQGAPSGAKTDYFRYSFYNSTTSWNADGGKGTMLNRVYFDRGQNDNYRTEYFDPKSQEGKTLMLANRYNNQAFPISNRYARLGVELMRPDEAVDGAVEVEDSVYITDMSACFTAEKITTWQTSDQYLNASCSSGSNLEYRWQTTAGGAFTSYSSSPVLDLEGYASTGPQTVILQIRNSSTLQTTQESKTINVTSGQMSIAGPTFVMDKQSKSYTVSPVASRWHERTAGSQTWSPGVGPSSTYQRIWAAGNYSVDLRADSSTSSTLRRAKVTVTVCAANCLELRAPASQPTMNEWGLLGAGPVISTGTAAAPNVRQFYELTGAHDVNSPFAQVGWFEQSVGSAVTPLADMQWQREPISSSDVRAFSFSVTPRNPLASYVFGFAWDPDLGAPADDQSGFDAERNLLYAFDGSGAVGLLLLSNGSPEIVSVEQYGALKSPPSSPQGVFTRQRQQDVNLTTGSSDVQFMLAGKTAAGTRTWRVVFVKGSSVANLKSNVDALMKR